MNDYWIYEDTIIFKPEFDGSLDIYNDILTQYNKLVFSDYNNLKICIETNNIYNIKYESNFIRNKFNQEVNLPPNLTHLTFGYYFNQQVNNLPKSLIHLTFGYKFNQKVENLPNLITYLTFGRKFNQKAENLPNLITHLTLSKKFSFTKFITYDLQNFKKILKKKYNNIENIITLDSESDSNSDYDSDSN
jgi:hypothetical protein